MQINIGKILTGLLTFFVSVLEIILGMRFVLKLLAASSSADFTLTVYNTSDALVAPFEGVFPSFEAANFTLEISTILAMIVYGIGGFIFIYLAQNFEGLSVTPGSKPNSHPAVNQNPSQPQIPQPVQHVTQPMPMAPQPMPQHQTPPQPTTQPMPQPQPQPMAQYLVNSPLVENQSTNQPMNQHQMASETPTYNQQPEGSPLQTGHSQSHTEQPTNAVSMGDSPQTPTNPPMPNNEGSTNN